MGSESDSLLFSALVQELRLPLLQISRLNEIQGMDVAADIGLISEQTLRLVDAYSLAVSKQQLEYEPVNIRNILYETAHTISPFAELTGFAVEVDERVSVTPVITHRTNLQALLALLATSLMNSPSDETQHRRLLLASHQLPTGTVVGAFSNQSTALSHVLPAARNLYGKAHQAAPELGQTGSASLAIADRLGQQMAAPLKTYRHNNLAGIGSLLMPSRQLHLSM